ncbi:MAG TPA: sulfotransferase [Stellaceae bacterium]
MPLPLISRLRTAGARARDFRDALALQRRGRLAEAESCYRAVLQNDPGHLQAMFNLGLVCVRRGAVENAIELFRRAVAQKPDFAEAHNALGIALRLAGQQEAALAHYAAALAVKPGYAEVENNFGLALQALGRHADAVEHYRNALALAPDYFEAENNIGAALRALHRHPEAVEHYRNALALKPHSANAHNNLGVALQLLGQHDAALGEFEQALALDPNLAAAWHGRGTVQRTLGRLDEARQAIEQAIALAPRRAEFYRSLAETRRFTTDDRHFALIEALARDIATLPEDDRIHLHFALGKVYADLDDHDRAFGHLLEGNALKRAQVAYDEAAVMAYFDRIRALFNSGVMQERAGAGDPSPVPVFIFGMPRSGTSLVEQILASHPLVHGAGELGDFELAVAALGGGDGVPPDIGGAELRRIGAHYLAAVRPRAPTARHITDKMPANFRFAGLIHLALPNARFVHLRRDPVDTCLSCFSLLFGGEQPYAYDLAELGRFYRAYEKLMAHWRAVLPPGVMLEVRYEELVADFEPQVRAILAHCGLEWHDSCLDFYKTERPVHTASATQVRRPLYRSSVGRWRPADAVLRPLLDALAGN